MLHEHKADSPHRHVMPPMTATEHGVEDLTNFLNAQVNPPAPAAKKWLLTANE
jgi:hypothetical protein